VNKINEEIQILNQQISENNALVLDIKTNIENSSIALASGELSASDFLALKQTLREKQTLSDDLLEIAKIQEKAKTELSGKDFFSPGLKKQIRLLASFKINLIEQLAKESAKNLSISTKDEIKKLIQLAGAGGNHGRSNGIISGDLYSDIGKLLCDDLFPVNDWGQQRMTFSELKKEADEMVEVLA